VRLTFEALGAKRSMLTWKLLYPARKEKLPTYLVFFFTISQFHTLWKPLLLFPAINPPFSVSGMSFFEQRKLV
jgi:hypothetical protein